MSAPNLSKPPLNIALIGFHGVQSLDLAGPADVFNAVNELLAPREPAYRILVASPTGGDVVTTSGLTLGGTGAIADLPTELDTIIVAGGSEQALLELRDTSLSAWLSQRAIRTRRVASVCTGAFILAYAGLLAGRHATTHWHSCGLLGEMWPDIKVSPDALFVADPPIYTSAGVTAGIDLCLALVEQDLGAGVANDAARRLVTYMRRPGGQSQFSLTLKAQSAATPAISRLLADISDNPGGDLRVSVLADRVGMTERTFIRRFHKETGLSPARFVQQARVEQAKTLLENSNWPLARIADRAGFGSVFSLHRAFNDLLGISPGDYRARFGRIVDRQT